MRRREGRRRRGVQGEAACRERDRGGRDLTVDRQRDVDRPVGTSLLTELARAVEGIDDPDAPHRQPLGVVDALLGQHGVVGVRSSQRRHDEMVGGEVAFGAELLGVGAGRVHRGPQRDEQLPGLGRDGGRVAVVVGRRGHGRGR